MASRVINAVTTRNSLAINELSKSSVWQKQFGEEVWPAKNDWNEDHLKPKQVHMFTLFTEMHFFPTPCSDINLSEKQSEVFDKIPR